MSVKICIHGGGRVAQHYKYILDQVETALFSVVGVCDLDIKKAADLAKAFNCNSYTSNIRMLQDCKPDITFILTPSGSHYQHASEALSHNSHVLVEKPPVMTPSEGYSLKEYAESKRLMISVAFQNRLNPAIICMRDAILKKRFKKIVSCSVRLRWCRYQPYYNDDWHGTWKNDGGVINQQAIHHVDALNWLVGPIDSVCASMSNALNILEAEDTMTALLKFRNGALGTIEATTAARPIDIEASLSIVGEGGVAEVGGIALNKIKAWEFVDKNSYDEKVMDKYSVDVPNGYGLSHTEIIVQSLEAITSKKLIPPVSLESALKTCKLIHALYSSVEKEKWVHLTDSPLSLKLGI